MTGRRVDVVGQTFGRLVVREMRYEPHKDSRALCECSCGGFVVALVYNLRNGNTASCGCLAREHSTTQGRLLGPIQGKKNATHGMSDTRTYASWKDAKRRCFDPKNKRYPEYGGRGIGMSREWRNSFGAFFASMGEAPDGMTLERVNVDGNYEPGNCRWATKAEQARNTRSNKANWEMVREMRRRHANGESSARLAAEFGMCWTNAKYIVSGVTWRE